MTQAAKQIVNDNDLDMLFRQARTYNGWLNKPVTDLQIHAIYDLLKWAPTSANCSPARFIFVKSDAAKKKLEPCLDAGNLQKTMTAPTTAIIITDKKFYDQLPKLFPHTDARAWFVGNQPLIEEASFRNATLQGAYLIMAARSLGLDCGPMSGFDAKKVKAAFFPDQPDWEANFLCNIGYGDPASLYPRLPRLGFDEASKII